MASIKKRGDSYLITVSLGRDPEGKKITESTTFHPTAQTPKAIEKEVDDFARQWEKEVRDGNVFDGEKITFSQFMKVWEENWLPQKTQLVQEKCLDALRVRVVPHIGQMKLSKIRATHIDKILSDEKKAKKAPQTIRYTFTVINSVFRYALKKAVIKENPCDRTDDLPSIKLNSDLHFFDLDQGKRFLQALDGQYPVKISGHKRTLKSTGEEYTVPDYVEMRTVPLQFKVFFTLAFYGGFRRGELCALTWNDLDPDQSVIRIRHSLSKTKSGQIIKDPKTVRGVRDVTMPKLCFDLLDQWKKEQIALALDLGTQWKGKRGKEYDDNFIFIQADTGEAMNVDTPTHKFQELIASYNSTVKEEDQKLPQIRLHDLRHTSISYLIAQGVPITTVQKRVGHSKASTTLDVYAHSLPAQDQLASKALETMLG